MNYSGKFDASLSTNGAGLAHGQLHVDSVSSHAPADSIIIPDANLLFNGDIKRSGVDLILAKDSQELVLHDYFKGEKRAALASPDGAHLTGDIINALTGHQQFAQADGSASVAKVIGHVTKLSGTATAIRNGVSIILNNGDNVEKGDVVQSGSNSTLGITFIDGTVFGLSSNAKMVLNDMVYDPNGSNNSSLMSLVAGTISFVAGETAKHGDMKVDTPVATMGIRGTAVLVEIDFEVPAAGGAPPAKFQVLVEPDGTTGSYILFDKTTLTPIATVNQAGTQTVINGQGTVTFLTSAPLSLDAQKIITEVFSQKFTDNSNPKSNDQHTDTPIPELLAPIQVAGQIVIPTVLVVHVEDKSGPTSGGPGSAPPRVNIAPDVVTFNKAMTELAGVTASTTLDTISGDVRFADLNAGDHPFVKTYFDSYAYQDANHNNVTASLTAEQIAAIVAVEIPLTIAADPSQTNNNNGFSTWTYSIADGAFDFLADGETLTLTYMAEVHNNFAPNDLITTKPFTITITGTNDLPTVAATSSGITELVGTGNTAVDVASGTVIFTDVDLTNRPVVSASFGSFKYLDAHGNDVTATLSAEQLAAVQAVEVDLDVVQTPGNTHDGSATWTYRLADHAFDFLAKGETLVLNYVAQVDDGHGGIVSTPIVVSVNGADVTVDGTNDLPVVGVTSNAFTERAGTNNATPDTVTGTVTFTDVDLTDRPVASAAFTSFTYTDAAHLALTLTAQQQAAVAAVAAPLAISVTQTGTNSNNGSATWTYSLADKNFDFLAEGEILTLTFAATVNDGNGGIVSKPFTVTITGTNDVPTIAATSDSFKELAGTSNAANDHAGGTITFTDVDLTDRPVVTAPFSGYSYKAGDGVTNLTLTPAQESALEAALTLTAAGTNANNGSVTWSYDVADNKFDFLSEGETLTLTYIATVNDSKTGGITTQPITVTITGTNDAPAISAIAQQNLTEQTDTAPLTTTIPVTFTDVDLSDIGHTAAITHAVATGTTAGLALNEAALIALVTPGAVTKNFGSSAGSVDLAFSAASTAFDYLSAGETLTLTYTVAIDDHDGGITPKTFVVTVTGTNDAPVIAAIAQQNLTEQTDTAPLTTTIAVAFTDVDLTDVGHTAAITHAVATGTTTGLALDEAALMALVTPGIVTKVSGSSNGSVNLGFSAASTAFDYLSAGESVTLTYTVAIDDHDGGITSKTFVVTVTGTNDAPVIAAITQQNLTEQTDTAPLTTTIAVAFTDVDLTDVGHTAAVTHAVATGTTAGLALDEAALVALVTPGIVSKNAGSSSGSVNLAFSAASTAFDYLAAGETLTLTYTVAIDDHDGGVTSKTFVVTIAGTNDAPAGNSTPVITPIPQQNLTEQTDANPLTKTIPVTFTDVDLTNIGHTAQITDAVASGTTTGLALDQAALIALLTPGIVTKNSGSSAGSVNLAFSAASTAFDYLAAGQTLTLTYTLAINDHSGGITSTTFVVTVAGTNDAPVIAAIMQQNLTEQTDTNPLTATIPVSFTDVDLTDVGHTAAVTHAVAAGATTGLALDEAALMALVTPGIVTKASGSSSGSVNLGFSAASTAFDYLSAGQTLTLTYTVAIDDHDGGVTSKTFVVTIAGSNDAPVIAAITQQNLTEQTDTNPLTATVPVTFTDVDLADVGHTAAITHAVATGATTGLALDEAALIALVTPGIVAKASGSSAGSVNLGFSAASTAFDYLSAGQTLTLTYTVAIDDHDGGVTPKTFVVTIAGSNDAPVIAAIAQQNLTEQADSNPLTTTIPVTFTDVDLTDVGHTAAITHAVATGTTTGLGLDEAALIALVTSQTVLKAAGSSSGSVDLVFSAASTAFDYLAVGQSVTLTYTVAINDHDGGVTPKTFVVTIAGSNDAPSITAVAANGDSAGADLTQSSAAQGAHGTLTVADPDVTDTVSVAVGHVDVYINGVLHTDPVGGLSNEMFKSYLAVPLGTVLSGSETSDQFTWNFDAKGASFSFLGAGDTLSLHYTIVADDGHIPTGSDVVTINIAGAEDAPAILGETDAAAQTVVVTTRAAPVVLAEGINTNSLGLGTETFDTNTGGSDFHSAALDATFHASGPAGVVLGSVSGVTAAPFIGPLPGMSDPTYYLTIGGGGTETITFAQEENAFGLYWGSIDTYNTIDFYDGNTLVAHYSGAEIAPLFANGNQGSFASNGYVEFSGLHSFNKVVLGSGSTNAFEVDDISAGSVAPSHAGIVAPVSGTLTVKDADVGDTLTASVGVGSIDFHGATPPAAATVAALTSAADVTFDSVQSNGGPQVLHWTYHPANADLDFLKAGETLTITYAAQVDDGHGHLGSQPLTVSITGADPVANMSTFGVVNGTSGNDSFNNVGGGVTIFGGGGHDTFVFNPGFGSAIIADFDVNNDTIYIDPSLVTSISAFLDTARPINSNHDTILTDALNHTITLKGVTPDQIQAHPNDFHLT